MYIDPRKMESLLQVKDGVPEKFADIPYQQVGIDLRIDSVCEIRDVGNSFYIFDGKEEVFDKKTASYPLDWTGVGDTVNIERGYAYQIESHLRFDQEIPKNVVAYVYGRSTFSRLGLLIRSALYDSGYRGSIGATLFAFVPATIQRYFRFAQIVFAQAETVHMYRGQYQERKDKDE